jgi:predicted alpha/beta-fold hydrolase
VWTYVVRHESIWIVLAVLCNIPATNLVLLLIKQRLNGRIDVVCAENPYTFAVRNELDSHIKNYKPTLWLPFSIMKSMYQGDKQFKDLSVYHRLEYKMTDGEILAVDCYPKNFLELVNTPIIMFVPGVFGMSSDVYSLEFCKMVWNQLRWRTCVFNRRGYGGMPIRGTRVVGFTSYDDMHSVVAQLDNQFPQAGVYLVGVSMGAANIQRFLAEYPEEHRVKAAVTISSPWNAHVVSEKVKRNPLLRKGIHGYQVKLFKQQLENESFNNLLKQKNICPNAVLSTKDNKDFDYELSAKGLNHQRAEEYYEALSSHQMMDRIHVPMLSINSSDDLLIPTSVIPFEEIKLNPRIVHYQVAGGGHTEYFTGFRPRYVVYLLTTVGI